VGAHAGRSFILGTNTLGTGLGLCDRKCCALEAAWTGVTAASSNIGEGPAWAACIRPADFCGGFEAAAPQQLVRLEIKRAAGRPAGINPLLRARIQARRVHYARHQN